MTPTQELLFKLIGLIGKDCHSVSIFDTLLYHFTELHYCILIDLSLSFGDIAKTP